MNFWLEPINSEDFVRNREHLNARFLEKHPETHVVLYEFLRQRDVSEFMPDFDMPVTRAKAALLGKTTSHLISDLFNIHCIDEWIKIQVLTQEIVEAATLLGLFTSKCHDSQNGEWAITIVLLYANSMLNRDWKRLWLYKIKKMLSP